MTNLFAEREASRWMRRNASNFVRPDWRRYVRPESEAAAVFTRYERKWREDQLRDWHGRFADEGLKPVSADANERTSPEPSTADVQRRAEKIAASSRTGYLRCIDICSPLLERFQKPGSDRNQWDFINA